MFQKTGDAHTHAHSCMCTHSHTVNTTLLRPQAEHTAVEIEFQTQSMLQGNCIVNQCLSEPRQWSGLHSPFLQIGYEGYRSGVIFSQCIMHCMDPPEGFSFLEICQVTHLSRQLFFLCFQFAFTSRD